MPKRVGIKRRRTKKRSLKPYQKGYFRKSGFYGRFSGCAPGCAPELKYFDGNDQVSNVAAAGAVWDSLNEIPQGTTAITRIGRKAVIKSLKLNYTVQLPMQTGESDPKHGDTVRMIVFIDKQANGATAAVTDILESAAWKSYYNLANSDRFQILLDKYHNLNYLTLAADQANNFDQGEVEKHYLRNFKLNMPVEFSSTTGAITEIRSNNIGILWISNHAEAHVFMRWRLRFTDGG
jgi:hypothetical protein